MVCCEKAGTINSFVRRNLRMYSFIRIACKRRLLSKCYLPVETQLWSSLWGRLVKMSWSVPCPSVQSCLLGTWCRERGCVKSPLAHLSLSLPPLPSLGDKDGSVVHCWCVVPPWACPEPVPSEMVFCVFVCVPSLCLHWHTRARTHNFQCVKGCSEVLLAWFPPFTAVNNIWLSVTHKAWRYYVSVMAASDYIGSIESIKGHSRCEIEKKVTHYNPSSMSTSRPWCSQRAALRLQLQIDAAVSF